MQGILTFFQEMLLCKNNDRIKIGLTQFKIDKPVEKPQKTIKSSNEVKLSDLMRRS